MLTPSLLMEDHREAYFFWKKLGLHDCTCIHVDAHLDTCELALPGAAGLARPEIHCGNYLLHAMREGIVRELVWVVPPHLPDIQEEIQAWVRPTLAEHRSWRDRGGWMEGELKGCRMVVCPSDRIPVLAGPVLLDIDADYFLSPLDEVWQTPAELAEHLADVPLAALTVAYSVEGGYTPLWLRSLGDQTMRAFGHAARACWEEAAAHVRDLREEFDAPGYRRAAELDPGYALSALDAACFHLQRKSYDACLAWLDRSDDAQAAAYLRAFVHFAREEFETASWEKLLGESDEKRHLLEMLGLSQMALGRYTEAVASFGEATRLDPGDAGLWLALARAEAQAGRREEAARSYRRGISLGPELLICLEAQLELVRLYQELGQPSLAQAQKKRLLTHPLPPALRLQAFSSILRP